MRDAVHIDGSFGEGGGQILRTSLALSAATGRPVRFVNIRAGRKKPGLQAQHLAGVRAVAEVCHARVVGAGLGAQALDFEPGPVSAGPHVHRFVIGTAGATSLVVHAVLPALLHAGVEAHLTIEGGTHVPMAPVTEHLRLAYAGALARMGARVDVDLLAHGFFPKGLGCVFVRVEAPADRDMPLGRLEMLERGPVRALRLHVIRGDRLPHHIVTREVATLRAGLGRRALDEIVHVSTDRLGNALVLMVESEQAVEVFSSIGERGRPAEEVARRLAAEVNGYLDADVPVGAHLADQLLLPMVLGRGGAFVTTTPTLHTTTNIEVIRRFLDVDIRVEPHGPGRVRIAVPSP